MSPGEVLSQWIEDGAGEKIIGLLVAGRDRPLRGEEFEYRDVYGVWVITGKDGSRLVLKASSVIGIEQAAPEKAG